jgi:uncharacterized membrane protein
MPGEASRVRPSLASRIPPGLAHRIPKAIAILGLVVAPLGIHLAMATQRGMVFAGVLVIAEAVLVAWIALSFVPVRGVRWGGCAAVLLVTATVWWFAPAGIFASSAIPHAIAYISVLTVFATSLAPGHKPIVTIFAERSRGELPPSVALYTRRVTWCVFCAGQLLGSLGLLLFAPAQVWSTFVNVLNLPLLVAMFCGEFAWRKWRHGAWPRERLIDGFRMAGQISTRDRA